MFVTLPEAGINDIAASYLLDVLQLCSDTAATRFETVGMVVLGVTLVCGQFVLLPMMLKCCKLSDFGSMFIGLTCVLAMCLLGILVYFFNRNYIGYIFYIVLGLTYLNPPIILGALSKRLDEKEQGIGLGVLHLHCYMIILII